MEFVTLHSRVETLNHLARCGADAAVLAGGTDFMVQLSRGEIAPRVVLHVEGVRELASQDVVDGRPQFGALVSQRAIATDATLLRKHRGLTEAARQCGGWQTQAVGTIGGNICNASPAADLVPPLLAHGAMLTMEAAGRPARRLPLNDFLEGRRLTARMPDELLTAVDIDPCPPRSADTYLKVGRRRAMEIALVGLAIRVTLAADDRIADIRVAVGAAAPRAFRATDTETVLRGQALTSALLREAGAALVRQAAPITDVRGSRDYRLAVLPRLLARAVSDCAERAAAGAPA